MGQAEGGRRAATVLRVLLLLLVAYRVVYHAAYLSEHPLALGTFSDGYLYEQAARDIVAHPPLGTRPLPLQGIYSAFLAVGLCLDQSISRALLLQLAVAALGLWLFCRTASRMLGPASATLSTIVLLAFPTLAFYENKFLAVWLAVLCEILTLAAWFRAVAGRSGWRGWLWPLLCGAASGASLLARPNLLLAVPITAWSLAWAIGRGPARRRAMAAFVAGLVLATGPMAARNLAVTGRPEIFRSDGGWVAFYIGNNPRATGSWNDAGILSGNIDGEAAELVGALGIQAASRAEQNRLIGSALRRRALAYLEERPLDWLRLEARKLWLTIGNDDILQDYSIRGEQAVIPWAHRAGLPFGVLLAFGVLGLVVLWRNRAGRGDLEPAPTDHRPLVLLLSGQILAVLLACLVYFTSAQHRLPLVVPLALAAGPAVLAIHAWLRRLLARRRAAAHAAASVGGRAVAISPPPSWAVLAAGVLLAQAFVPRGEPAGTPPTYWYNVAYVQRSTGDYHGALRSVELAIRAAPGEARFLRERAEILRVMGRQNEARTATLEAERAASRDRVAPR